MERDQWSFEKNARAKGFRYVAGIDEAGRGPLAGPVVAAAVILPPSFDPDGVTDSKKLTPKKRDALYEKIYKVAVSIGIGMVDPHEIDRVNILRASLSAMAISAGNLKPGADFLLIDGNFSIPSDIPQKPIVKGDSLSVSISAASIVAKVTRDRMMVRHALDYPEFGFEKHKGYPTRAHREVLRRLGPSPIHRLTFKGSLPKTR
ncbi:Ribonuclease HII [Candidatus Desulfarcum epimagneticum]|uniref:Ribonuclease HII n=1 Tax=uncultured Desulfobacteraceae bacterium TaxID=218296 RepID=A0A484HEJ7_9BACT|nr:Ribonuclease HII [uncultured Desulfobacteraceae bacterium]